MIFGEQCTAMHVGDVTDEDIAAFASSGVMVNHNPLGNAMLGFGVASNRSLPRLMAAGVPIVLGSDYAPAMIASPFDMIHALLTVQREVDATDNVVTLEQALAMATGAGVTLGRPGRLGRIAPGQLADLVVVDSSAAHLGGSHPVPGLALRGRAEDVTTVIVDGQIVVDDGRVVTVDEAEAEAMAAAHRAFDTINRSAH